MRILHVITRFHRGGAEEKTLLELEHLRHEHEYALATGPSVEPEALARLADWGIPHIVIPSLRHYAPWSAPSAVRQLRRHLRKERYDLVHTHSTEAGILGREAAWRERVPGIVHTIHGNEFSPEHSFPIRTAVVHLHRRLAPRTHRYLSNAQVLVDRFLAQRIGRPEQYGLVRSGIDLEAVDRATPVPLDGGPVVLTASRLVRGKGLEEVIDAMARLRPRSPGLRLAIAGDGPLRDGLRRYAARRGIDRHVDFLGFRTDLPGLMKSASVFAFASHREGTPRAVTLALRAGCPVVATSVDGIPEQVVHGETGLLVPPRDPRALADALQACFNDAMEARRRALRARVHVEAFGLPRMLERLREEYDQLAGVIASKA